MTMYKTFITTLTYLKTRRTSKLSAINEICKNAKKAANAFMSVSSEEKNLILKGIKEQIIINKDKIVEYNKKDIQKAKQNGRNSAFIDRLTFTDQRIKAMSDGIDAIIKLDDAVGMIEDEYTIANGMQVKKVRSPLGVIGIIYEARPNVTIDATALCIKSSNAVILRGSKDAMSSNSYLVSLMKDVLKQRGYDDSLVGFIEGADRSYTQEFLQQGSLIDVVIPRGGEALKKYVLKNATMPVIASSGGNCHTYVESSADIDMAIKVITNAKLDRPSVCNALETILCDRALAKEFLSKCLKELQNKNVEIRGNKEVKEIFSDTIIVNDEEFFVEYNDLIVKVKIVNNIEEAIAHINYYGTNHSEAIITQDNTKADMFTKQVDSAAVYVNASTRFTDGFKLGLGAEMGISTQKLHVRGPIGLKELTSLKYVVTGSGHIR